MASTIGFIEAARSGLNAAQLGLNVTRQNISNADTVGYSRQSIDQSAAAPDSGSYRFLTTSMKIGQGVNINTVYQIRNEFLDVRYRQSYANYKLYSGMKTQLSTIEDQFNEFTDKTTNEKKLTGLSGLLDQVAAGIKDFQNQTSDPSISKVIESDVDYLLSTVNTDSKFLDSTLSSELKELNIYVNGGTGDTSESNDVSGIDGIIETIQGLNEQIQSYEITGQKANELRDQRNNLLDQLSSYIDITTKENDRGIVSIQLQGDSDDNNSKYIITDQNIANELDVKQKHDDTTGKDYTVLEWGKTRKADGSYADTGDFEGQVAHIGGGVVKSYLNVINGDGSGVDNPDTGRCGGMGIVYLKQKLNDFAKAFADDFNKVYKDNLADPSTAVDLIKYDATKPALSIAISNEWRATPENLVKGIPTDETSMSKYLQSLYDEFFTNQGSSVKITSLSGGASTDFGGTFSGFADTFAIELSSSISVLGGKADASKTSAANLDDQRKSISSVSVNDEGVNLIKYQQAYNASARIITAIDQMLDKLINGTGTVGL